MRDGSSEYYDQNNPPSNNNPDVNYDFNSAFPGDVSSQFQTSDDYLSPSAGFNDATTFASSVKSDPFLEDLENLNFPQSQSEFNVDNPQIDPSQSTNLDELISPGNNYLSTDNEFLNPQYFSPPHRNNFNNLNSIAEDSLQNSFNTFSPGNASHDGGFSLSAAAATNSSLPPPSSNYADINNGYLSPNHSNFVSPGHHDGSFDTLRSPTFNSGSYLSSPPTYNQLPTSQSNSYVPPTTMSNVLSPPRVSHLGTSAPSSSNPVSHVSTKQLTKEEKLKRRREFHNAVERRRRDLIKERIKELGLLVPPSLLNPQVSAVQALQKNSDHNSKEINDLLASVKVKDTKPNKSTILNKSVDYIIHLKYVLEQQQETRVALDREIAALEGKLAGTTLDSSLDFQPPTQDEYFNPDEFFSDIVGTDPAV